LDGEYGDGANFPFTTERQMNEAGDERVRKMMDLIPEDWDKGPMVLSTELRTFLKTLVDEGTNIDSGGGNGLADLHPIIGGIEYHIQITTTGPRSTRNKR
jgi:hypothetical protein